MFSEFFIFSKYQVIVMELTDGQDQGKSSDPKYAKVTRKYEDRVAGEPYVTAEFANNNEKRTSFPVGDGKYYSTEGVTDAKRKRRKGESIDLTTHNQSDMTFELIIHMRKKMKKFNLSESLELRYGFDALGICNLQRKGSSL